MAEQPAERDDDADGSGDRAPTDQPWSTPDLIDRVRRWVAWIGPGRLAGSVGAVLVMAGLGWWLLRSPALPTEAGLPRVPDRVTTAGLSAPDQASSLPARPPTGSIVADDEVLVHVTGAVARPGVYELTAGQRVDDAIAAAGGPTAAANADVLNLAAPVADGDRIEVPAAAAPTVAGADGGAADGQSGGITSGPGAGHTNADGDAGAPAADAPVDLNEADIAALDALPGIGPATAAAIIQHRTDNGPFGSVDDLLDVTGIGPAKLEAVRDLVVT